MNRAADKSEPTPPTLSYLTPAIRKDRHSPAWDVASDYLGGTWLGGLISIPVAIVFGWGMDVCGLSAVCWVFGFAPTLLLALTIFIRSRIDQTTMRGRDAHGMMPLLAGAVWSIGLIGCVIAARHFSWRLSSGESLPAMVAWTLIEPIAAGFLLVTGPKQPAA